MRGSAAADSAAPSADTADNPSRYVARDLDPVIVSDAIFDDPGYSPLDLYTNSHAPHASSDITFETASGTTPEGTPAVPVVASCPHAGRSYPASMLAAAQEPASALRGLEDFGVDCLLPGLAQAGITTLINRLARAYIDVNRDTDAVDASMFTGDVSTRPANHLVRAGYGLIPRLTATRKPIYAEKLPAAELQKRLRNVHTPYHTALTSLLDSTQTYFGEVLLVDMHSMPAFDRLNNRLADIICGDGFGMTLDRDTASAITGFFKERGLSITWNHPYAGGYITRAYGKAGSPRQSVQIEINRGLYMDGPARLDQARVAEVRDLFGAFGRFLAHYRTGAP